MSADTATRTGRLAFRGLCMQHGCNSKRLADDFSDIGNCIIGHRCQPGQI